MRLLPTAPCLPQARTRKLAERKVGRAELEEMERRRAAEEAEDKKATTRMLRWGVLPFGFSLSISSDAVPPAARSHRLIPALVVF